MNSTPELPNLPAVFRGIKSGHHWCFGDAEYGELNERFDEYRAFFGSLELNLHRDPRGFIYATTDESDYKGSERITRFVVFTAVWVDAAADEGADLAARLFAPHQRLTELPHLAGESHRRAMAQIGVQSVDDLRDVVRDLERLGLVEIDSQGLFSLRPAFHRLLDVCLEAGRAVESPGPTARKSENSDPTKSDLTDASGDGGAE